MLPTSFWRRLFIVVSLVIFILVALASFELLSQPSVAHASTTSGEQIQFTCGPGGVTGLRSVTITGPNQSWHQATWNYYLPVWNPISPQSVTTWGWWWQGNVTIQWTFQEGGGGSVLVYVPSQWNKNVFTWHC